MSKQSKTEEVEFLKPKRTDVHLIDARAINVVEEFNRRFDYGDMEELTESIREDGVLQPIKCFRKDGLIYLLSGHRRHRACMNLVKEGIEIYMPVIFESKKTSPEQRLIEMIKFNEGKRLNMLEEADIVSRLSKYGLSDTQISKKISKSLTYISNLTLLNSAPEKIKAIVRTEQISPTLMLNLMRDTPDFEKLQELIHETSISITGVVGEKPVKIKKKDIQKAQKKTNSVSALRKAFKQADKEAFVVNPKNKELYDFALAIIDGQYSKEEIINMLFVDSQKNKKSAPAKTSKQKALFESDSSEEE